MSTGHIDWVSLREKLPMEKTPEAKAKRIEIFKQFDPNGSGVLSLAEVDKGCRDVLGLYEIFNCKPVIIRAFNSAKSLANSKKGGKGAEYIEFKEFRLMLVYLREYFEIWQMFDEIDTGNDRRINLDEFKAALPKLERWGVKVEDPEAEFKKIDKNEGGELLFIEFVDWAVLNNLDLEDDDD